MAEAIINPTAPNTHMDALSDPPSTSVEGSLFCRRIDFHLARKPFTGFSNGSGDFRLETLNPSSQNPGSDQVNGPLPLVGKKPEENGLDPELSFEITFRRIVRIGAGLQNLGNTCFLNSVLQCLTYTEPLAAYLQSGKHQVSCRTSGFCALCAIQRHVSRALQSTGRIVSPKELVSNLRCISRNFRNSRQEDAHEYMVNFLEAMHKCCLPAGVPSGSPSAYQKSLIHKIFGGRLRSQVKCMQCNHCSDTFDPFLDLSLEINKADSLYKALAHFTAKEQLDGGERHYQCERCKQKVKALKQLTIHKAPDVLIVHLKRFGSHHQGQKIDKKILFAPNLDLKPFVTGPYDGDMKYNLFGVLVHAGWSTHSGHYFSFVRTSSGMWYNLDDNQVVQVSEKRVLEQKAYMLFYSRERKQFAPKKPIHIVPKENMAINGIERNSPFTNFNQNPNKNNLYNGPVEIQLDTPKSSVAVAQQDSLKESSLQRTNGLIATQVSSDNKTQNGRESLPQLDKVSNGTSKVDTKTGGKMNSAEVLPSGNASENMVTKKDLSETAVMSVNCNGNTSSKKDFSDSIVVPSNCNGLHNSAVSTSVENVRKDLSLDVVGGGISEKVEPSSQARDFTQKSSSGDSITEKSDAQVQKLADCVSAQLSSSSVPTQKNHKKDLDRKPHQKRKKKHIMRTTMHLSTSILFGSSLKLKKKKHKKSKLGLKNLSKEQLLNGEFNQTDLGPSTSEKISAIIPIDTSSNGKTKRASGSKKKENNLVKNADVANSNGDVSAVNKEFRERNCQNGAVLAAADDEKPKISSNVSREVNGSKDDRNDSKQNGMMNMLTRGLEDTIVKRWDEMESFPSVLAEQSDGVKNVTIGYIGDEWDEEYDRGKRKKLKGIKNSFGGPNPFQEIATSKANFKKAKLDHSSSANRPYRIK